MDQSICTVDGCSRALHVRKRGFCQYHYLQWWKNRDSSTLTPSPVEHPCEACGAPTANPKFCSGLCRESGKWERRKASPQYEEQKARARAAYVPRERVIKPKLVKLCQRTDCQETVRARGLCGRHYRQEMKALGLWKPSPADHWSAPNRMARAIQRKAMKRGAAVSGEAFTIQDLLERDGPVCALCYGRIDTTLAWPHPMYPTIDHITPISRGGEHSLANAQPAHFRCNIRAGAKPEGVAHGPSQQPAAGAA